MVTIRYEGRLSNNIIQLLAGYFFAKRHGLMFNPDLSKIDMEAGGDCGLLVKRSALPLYGDECDGDRVLVDDTTFLSLYESDFLPRARYDLVGYFQDRKFLSSIRPMLDDVLRIVYDRADDMDVFVHYRIGDLLLHQRGSERIYTPRQFINEALKKTDFRKGYITGDTPDHPDFMYLQRKFGLTVVKMPPLETILYGKNFHRLVLSEFSFSGLIGYLSQAHTIHSNRRECWCFEPGTISVGFDHYNLGSWGYLGGSLVNFSNARLNDAMSEITKSAPSMVRIRDLVYECESVVELSKGDHAHTIAILSGHPETLTCQYHLQAGEQDAGAATLFEYASSTMTKLTFSDVGPKEYDDCDMVVCVWCDVGSWTTLMSSVHKVRKYLVVSVDIVDEIERDYLRQFRISRQDNILVSRLETYGFSFVSDGVYLYFRRNP